MNYYKIFGLGLVLISLSWMGCSNTPEAKDIIAESIAAHGGKNYEDIDVRFIFRKDTLSITLKGGTYLYTRTYADSTGNHFADTLSNTGFIHTKNGGLLILNADSTASLTEKLNSIVYFVLLPYRLQDASVQPRFAGTTNILGAEHKKIEVRFIKQHGGKDYTDTYCYWINNKTHLVDYLSYSNGGTRFRKAVNRKTVQGILFQDYENYVFADSTLPPIQADTLFAKGKASLLSNISNTFY